MKYRKLGKNGPTVSAIGLGAGSATTNFGERDDEVQIDTVHRAIDLGVTLFDTADRCMKGRHERMLGRALKGRRDKVVVCTKFGNIDNPDGTKAYNGRPEYVRSACDASLKQLGIETIDLYYLHRIDPDVRIEDTVGAMAGLVKAGKVRWLGLSEAGPDSLRRASKIHPITALQTEYSLWARDVEDRILPAWQLRKKSRADQAAGGDRREARRHAGAGRARVARLARRGRVPDSGHEAGKMASAERRGGGHSARRERDRNPLVHISTGCKSGRALRSGILRYPGSLSRPFPLLF